MFSNKGAFRSICIGLLVGMTSVTTYAQHTVTPLAILPLQGGTITNNPLVQSIAYNTSPSQLTATAATGGTTGVTTTYQWMYSYSNSNFQPISAATGLNYQPGNLTTTTYFVRQATNGTKTAYTTDTATVLVIPPPPPPIVPGTISPLSQTVCTGMNKIPSLTLSGVSGGTGSYAYQWQISTDAVNFSNVMHADSLTHVLFLQVFSVPTYFRVVVTSGSNSAYSDTASINMFPVFQPGAVSPSTQAINYNTNAGTLSMQGLSGGNGTYSYQWQSAPDNSTWTNINSATAATYTPTNLTSNIYYRVSVSSNCGDGYSTSALVTVYPQLQVGSLSPASASIVYNTDPGPLTLGNVSGGNGSYSYQWQQSQDGTNYSNINVTGTSYDPGILTAPTWYKVLVNSNGATVSSSPAAISIITSPGLLTPASLTVASGTSPGILTCTPAIGGGCGGKFGYQWQSSPDNVTWTNISGDTLLTYSPGNLSSTTNYRLMVTCGAEIEYSNTSQITVGAINTDLNYIRERTVTKAGVTDTVTADQLTNPLDVQQTTQYFDGLGRPIQTVAKQASPLLNDMVSMQSYDPFGREAVKYMPYTSSSNNGNFKPNAQSEQTSFNTAQFPGEQYYYGLVNFEPSPLNRPLTVFAPGYNWVGSDRGIASQYGVNSLSDSIQIWNIAMASGSIPIDAGIYPAGQLYKNITIDEQGHQVIEYKDKLEHTILKKVQLAGTPGTAHAGWLCTYYIYDDLSNLRFVIQPRAVELINTGSVWTINQAIANELCFRYEYDQLKRMSIKKIPGAGEAWMVYDARDRLVMSQDSALRSQQKWLFTRYDGLNRVDSTGLLTDPSNYNNLAYHQNLASSSTTYPPLAGYTTELLTQTWYDTYSWVTGGMGGITSTMNQNWSNATYFITSYNTSPVYAVPLTAFPVVRGMATGGMTKVIGTTNQYLYSVHFFDDRARMLQSQSVNYTGGLDISTTQYNFSGKPLHQLLNHNKNGNTAQTHLILDRITYDAGLRVKNITRNIDGASVNQLIDSMQYDELGRLRAKYLGNNLDSMIYDYNIRGWVTGINKGYVAGTASHYFGMELGYDQSASIVNTTSYDHPQFNGNIGGLIWKSLGDGINRKYDFQYDSVNRLTNAIFNQNTSGTTWEATTMCYSVHGPDADNGYGIKYDANGNILDMINHGWKLGNGNSYIDYLFYTYMPNSNKLQQVIDGFNDSTSKLGDFHYNPSTKTATDYTYDGNGNLISDNNKAIDRITYNYLNLPQVVHMNGKGNITYTYDASGTKLKKVTADSLSKHSTTTLYLGNFIYQQTDTITNPGGGIDTLQFVTHDEGRTRWAYHKYLNGSSAYGYEYDFFERDHLGNTRILLTQEKDTTKYIATMEAAYRNTEDMLFYNIQSSCYARSAAAAYGYPADTSVTNPNDSIVMLDPAAGQKVGPAIILKVMSGDKVDIGVNYYYKDTSVTIGQTLSPSDLINSLAGGIVGLTGGLHGSFTDLTGGSSPLGLALSSFINSKNGTIAGKPNAYLNWVLLDNQFNYVNTNGQSGAMQVGPAGTTSGGGLQTPLAQSGISITKSGYLYIYVSNATPGWKVFFDNLSVKQYSGPLVEETHYYPGGLTMAGISDKALKSNYAENKYRFNAGSEQQNKEFSDGTGLEMYETRFRMLDVQLGGRFWQQDPLAVTLTDLSPYQFATNNPVSFSDPLGLDTVRISGEGAHKIKIGQGDVLAWTIGDQTSYYTYDPSNENAVNGFVGGGIDDGSMQAATVTAQSQHGDDASPWRVGTEWLTGTGPRAHHFRGADPFTRELSKHEHISQTKSMIAGIIGQGARGKIQGNNNYKLGGLSGVPKYIRDYSTLLTGGLTGNIAVTYLGSYGLKYEVLSVDEESGTARVHFTVTNSSTIESATHPPVIGYTQWWSNNVGKPLNNFFSSGPLSPTKQTFDWNETIKWK